MSDCSKKDSKGGDANGNGKGGAGGSDNGGNREKNQTNTAPVDPRFPNVNQTRYCYSMYCDYFRCQCLLGEEYAPCDFFKKVYTTMCPNAWIEKFDDQREQGIFVGRITPNV